MGQWFPQQFHLYASLAQKAFCDQGARKVPPHHAFTRQQHNLRPRSGGIIILKGRHN